MKSYKHKTTRIHIPSSEEAGYETANPAVRDGKTRTDLPLNPVIHRGDDPELFWKNKYPVDEAIGGILEKYQRRNAANVSKEEMLQGLQALYEAVKTQRTADKTITLNTTTTRSLPPAGLWTERLL